MKVLITIARHALSDDSLVFNVTIGETTLHAMTEQDAYRLADKLQEAIGSHTTEVPIVAYV